MVPGPLVVICPVKTNVVGQVLLDPGLTLALRFVTASGTGVSVGVLVGVFVGVLVGVSLGTTVGVFVAVLAGMLVDVLVGATVEAGTPVAVGDGVSVGA